MAPAVIGWWYKRVKARHIIRVDPIERADRVAHLEGVEPANMDRIRHQPGSAPTWCQHCETRTIAVLTVDGEYTCLSCSRRV